MPQMATKALAPINSRHLLMNLTTMILTITELSPFIHIN